MMTRVTSLSANLAGDIIGVSESNFDTPNCQNRFLYIFVSLDNKNVKDVVDALTAKFHWKAGTIDSDVFTVDCIYATPEEIDRKADALSRPYKIVGLSEHTRMADNVKFDICLSSTCLANKMLTLFAVFYHGSENLDDKDYMVCTCSCGMPLHYYRLSDGNSRRHVKCANCGAEFYLRVTKKSN